MALTIVVRHIEHVPDDCLSLFVSLYIGNNKGRRMIITMPRMICNGRPTLT